MRIVPAAAFLKAFTAVSAGTEHRGLLLACSTAHTVACEGFGDGEGHFGMQIRGTPAFLGDRKRGVDGMDLALALVQNLSI